MYHKSKAKQTKSYVQHSSGVQYVWQNENSCRDVQHLIII